MRFDIHDLGRYRQIKINVRVTRPQLAKPGYQPLLRNGAFGRQRNSPGGRVRECLGRYCDLVKRRRDFRKIGQALIGQGDASVLGAKEVNLETFLPTSHMVRDFGM